MISPDDLAAAWAASWPYITLAVTVASAIDTMPQPSEGSHWIPVRAAISWFALNIGGASNGKQPEFQTWILRVLRPIFAKQDLIVIPKRLLGQIPAEPSKEPTP